MICLWCAHLAVTTIPVTEGHGRVCREHAEQYWRGVVRAGAALAELGRAVDDELHRDWQVTQAEKVVPLERVAERRLWDVAG